MPGKIVTCHVCGQSHHVQGNKPVEGFVFPCSRCGNQVTLGSYDSKLRKRLADIENINAEQASMNIIEGIRVSWEIKKQYTDRLAELSAEGYLTPSEYEARLTWVDKSVTRDQMEVAFRDLPYNKESVRNVTPEMPVKQSRIIPLLTNPLISLLFIIAGTAATTTDLVHHHPVSASLSLILLLIGVMNLMLIFGTRRKK